MFLSRPTLLPLQRGDTVYNIAAACPQAHLIKLHKNVVTILYAYKAVIFEQRR